MQLGMEVEAKEDMKEYHELYPSPELEVYESKIIIRNIPDCECSNNMLKKYIGTVFCDSEDDVIISNGICIAKRKADCQCFVGHDRPPRDNRDSCREWCDDFATGGDLFCSRTFKTFPCQAACVATVQSIKKACHWCCNGGNFYGDCVEPFADILGKMGGFCDPAWD
jgi:hypothetical protein